MRALVDPLPAGARATTCASSPTTAASSCAATLGEIERRWEPHGFVRVHRQLRRRTCAARSRCRPQLNGDRDARGAPRSAGPVGATGGADSPAGCGCERRRPRAARAARRARRATAHGDVYLRRLRPRAADALAAGAGGVRRRHRRAAAGRSTCSPGCTTSTLLGRAAPDLARRRAAVPALPAIGWLYAAPSGRARRRVPRPGERAMTSSSLCGGRRDRRRSGSAPGASASPARRRTCSSPRAR